MDSANERFSPLSTPSATREVLERHGLFTKYGLGQNFLVNDDVIRKIIELADVRATDRILEVGPGIGTLTAALLPRAAHVTAIEKDRDLAPVLADTLAPWADTFTLISEDALNVTPDALPQPAPNKLVANLPYAVAATVVLDYLQRFDTLESVTVMVQKEVADRMTARPGTKAYGAYTVKLSLYARPAGRFSVAPGNFFPPPHVESTVLRLDRMPACDDPALAAAACRMADAAFANRRKTLANSCKTYFANDPTTLAALPDIFAAAGIDSRRRGETLTQSEFLALADAFLQA
ncbi:MAG: 16S rRNA (adenine(1518)-N(6)/adenine(1519)-N(6))-dimethyltransferase RsmA [Eggerthellaceae bacterium]|nr:16S rRNA (adenine(1518)-N(6)/adenine(1519)-N(6))-dimethyltransferase RsmA [Eggerthellaceae bacterium]